MAARDVSFRVLGPLAVSVDGSAVVLPRSPVLQGLLGVLLLARGEPLPTGRLAELVWTDRAQETSRQSVHVGVSRLRKWLALLNAGRSDQIKIIYRDGYLLQGAADRSDLGRFLALADEARSLTTPERRFRMLSAAFGERKGPLVAGLSRIDRADTLIQSLENDIRRTALELAAAALGTGLPEGAVMAIRALTEEFTFDEPLHAALIELLVASGRPAEAMQAYRRLSENLSVELGVEPGAEAQRAHMRILSADHTLDGPGVVPEPPPPAPVPAQLPPDVPDFTGRATEVAELVGTLIGGAGTPRQRTVAVAAVAGMGGIGKTAVAVHVAHLIAGFFSDGQLYVDLRGDSVRPVEPEEVLGWILRTLGASETSIPASLEERVAQYRSRVAGSRILVVLDNVAGEAQVRPLLPGAPNASVLITSRNNLVGLEGAKLLDLGVLTAVQAVALLTSIVGERRVLAEPDVAVEIARLCDHVPLAIRIAAARLRSRSHWTLTHLADILREERRRLDELVAGDLEIRTGFEMSYRLLPADTQRAFRLIGLLEAPGFACWTVAALLELPVSEAQRHLETLVDAHLVEVTGTDATGQLRYRLRDLLRLYARELAERDDSAAQRSSALRRALGSWLALAEEAAERMPGPCYAMMHGSAQRWAPPSAVKVQAVADPVRWFDAERSALVAEVAHACDLRFNEYGWDLAATMERYWDVRGLYDDWRHMHERALALCQEMGDKRGEAVLLRGLLEVITWTSPAEPGPVMSRMRGLAARLLELFAELEDTTGTADAMVASVWGMVAEGENRAALARAESALRVAHETNYAGGKARALHVMAVAYRDGDPQAAVECLERAMVVAEQLGNPRFVTTIVQFLGAARVLCGDVEDGRMLLDESIVMARELDDRYLETFSLLHLAKLFSATGDERARPTLELALTYCQTGDFRHHLADALGVLGEMNLAEGDVPGAIACLTRSVQVWRTRGWLPSLARTLRTLGDAHAAIGDHEAARISWTEARELFERIDDVGRGSADKRLTSERLVG